MRIALLTCYLLLVTSAHALTDAWSVNVNDHTAVQRTYKRGESIDMRITLRDGLRPLDLTGATARWYWYTNAVDNLWWTNAAAIPLPRSGLVSAQWTPAMDTGAALYPYWVGLWMPGSTSPLWRVTGTIRLLGSPGLNPNSQPVPVRTLDFASITVTNAPWVTAADWASGSNALASALLTVSGVASGAAAQAESNRQAIAALPPPSTDALRLVNSNATRWVDVTGGVWAVTQQIAANKLLLDFSDNASFFSGQCSVIDTVVDVPCVDVSCGQVLMSVGVNGWTMKNLFNTSSLIAGMFNIPVTFPITVNFSGAHQGSLTFRQITDHLTNCVDAVVFDSALTGNALRLINPTNSAEWIDGAGGRWRIDYPAVTNENQLLIYDSFYSSLGVRVMDRVSESEWSVGTTDADLIQAGDLYVENGFVVQGWVAGMEYMWSLSADPYDVNTFPKTFAHPSNGHTGWVDRVVSYQAVTSRWDEVANKSDLLAISADKELHADSFTNLIWRTVWSNGWCWAIAYTNTP